MTKPAEVLPMPGDGDVPMLFDGEEVFLKPSLRACIGISRLHNNPHETAGKIMAMDFDAITAVVGFGLGLAPSKALQEKIYRTGPVNMRPALISFIHIVNNGGRPIVEEAEQDAEGEDGKNPPETESL